jgi:hypothetical protein
MPFSNRYRQKRCQRRRIILHQIRNYDILRNIINLPQTNTLRRIENLPQQDTSDYDDYDSFLFVNQLFNGLSSFY